MYLYSKLQNLEKPIKINKTLSIEKLNHFCSTNNIIINFQQKKDKIIQDINQFVEKNFLKTIIKTKKKNSNQYDLIDLGFKIKNEFNNVNDFSKKDFHLYLTSIDTTLFSYSFYANSKKSS